MRPRVGCIAFPRLISDLPIEKFTAELAEEEGVMLLPGTVYEHSTKFLPSRPRQAQLP